MNIQIGRYKFKQGPGKGTKKLSPLSLEDLNGEVKGLSKMSIVVKKPDYGLIRFPRSEGIVKRMLYLTNNTRDQSRFFVVLYVNNTFVGYKSTSTLKIIPPFKNKQYIKYLDEFQFKKEKKSNKQEYKVLKDVKMYD